MFKAADFWHFSLERYARAGVKDACLKLQDEYGFNVNLLLLACYLNELNYGCNVRQFGQLIEAVLASQQGIQQHRMQRKMLKGTDHQQYQRLLAEELEMEKQQQQILIDTLCVIKPDKSRQDNLLNYCHAMKHELTDESGIYLAALY